MDALRIRELICQNCQTAVFLFKKIHSSLLKKWDIHSMSIPQLQIELIDYDWIYVHANGSTPDEVMSWV